MPISITLEHDDGVVRARSWLKGTVSISIDESGCPAEEASPFMDGEVHIHLVGEERTTTHDPTPTRRCTSLRRPFAPKITAAIASTQQQQDQEHQSMVTIYHDHKVLIVCPKEELSSGSTATYPFSMYLPHTLPPSMRLHYKAEEEESNPYTWGTTTSPATAVVGNCRGGSCSIHYRITAQYVAAQEQESAKTTTSEAGVLLQTERPLCIIGEAPSAMRYPFVLEPTSFPLNQDVLRRGHVTVAVRSENTHVGKGEWAYLTLALSNKSCQDIDSVEMKLYETVQWKTNVPSCETHGVEQNGSNGMGPQIQPRERMPFRKPSPPPPPRSMTHTTILKSYTNSNLHGLMAGEDSPSMRLSDTTPSAEELNKVDELVHQQTERNTLHIRVPVTSRASYSGQLIQITHQIQVVLDVKGLSRQNCPQVTIPVQVFDTPVAGCGLKHPSMLGPVDITIGPG